MRSEERENVMGTQQKAESRRTNLIASMNNRITKAIEEARAAARVSPSRELRLTITKLEEAQMWLARDYLLLHPTP